MRLTSLVPFIQLVTVDWNESDWVYPQVSGENKWFGSLQYYDALNGMYCLHFQGSSLFKDFVVHASAFLRGYGRWISFIPQSIPKSTGTHDISGHSQHTFPFSVCT